MTSQKACRDLDAMLSAYVDHEATAEEMATVKRHTLACRACAARLEHYQLQAPRLEADVRALLSRTELAGRRVTRPGFRDLSESLTPGGSPMGWLSRAATFALVLGIAFVAAVVLARTTPAVQSPGASTGAQPAAPTPGSTPNPPKPSARVLVVSVDGLVDPAVAAYLHRAVSAAEESQAGALVIVLDASGGLDGPMQQVTRDLTDSAVPTLAYIPRGQADSSNTLLAQSSDLTATATTPNLDAFLRAADGHEVQTPAGPLTLATAGAKTTMIEMEPLEAIAHRMLDPTIAYLLFVLGLYAVFVEIAHPGAFVPGAAGVVCLTIAAIAFATLPTNWLGVAVLIVAVGLMALELKAATHGALVLAGVVCLIVGSVLLYAVPGSGLPAHTEVTIAPGVLVGAAVIGLVGGLVLARIARQIHALPPVVNLERLIGARGVSRSGLDPEGVVHVGGQLWSARLRGGRLEADRPVRVVARHGLVLEVESTTLGAATRKGTLS
jgi:membrane-bound serine protease (ClpP class)